MFLDKFKKNYYSQAGEDGILIEILKRTGLGKKKNKWCCEFGAWDGVKGSNTFHLVEKYKFNAIYIEGNYNRFSLLIKLSKKFPKILSINKFVSHKKNSPNNLENILIKTKIKKHFEVLSIDIDSYDLTVWENLKKFDPMIVIIEINSFFRPGIFHKHNKLIQGNSFSSTLKVAKQKGYILLSHTGNCIFIKKNFQNKIKIPKNLVNNPNKLFDWSWVGKKQSYFVTIVKFLLPEFFLDMLRKIKNNII